MSNRGGAHRTCLDFRRSLMPDRRSFLKAGLLGSAGLALADRHHPVDARRAQPYRHVGPQARSSR